MATFKDTDIASAFSAVADLHPDAQRILERLLRQMGDFDKSMLAALTGDSKVCTAIVEREAKMLHPQGAIVIDCTGLSGQDLVFGTEQVGDGIRSAKGPIIEAWETGRPLVLQNFPRMKTGAAAELQNLLQLFSGELIEATFHSALGDEPYKFTRDDHKPGFRLRVTGDYVEYEENLSMSAQARLHAHHLSMTAEQEAAAEGEKLARSMTEGTARAVSAIPVLEIKKPK
jgi:hypothetical protein